MSAVVLLLAAGASSRMAPRDKLTEPVDGVPLIRERALAALGSGAPVIVTLPPDRPERRAALVDLAVTRVVVEDAALGMGASIAAGCRAAPDGAGVLILPADMPDVGAEHMRAMLAAARPGVVLRGASEGRPGHPVLFPAETLPRLRALGGDQGARAVLAGARVALHPLPGLAALTDLDTPEAWAAWRARRARGGASAPG